MPHLLYTVTVNGLEAGHGPARAIIPTAPTCTCTPPRELQQASGHARIALFLPRDARYGCLNSRGEALGAFADLISSKTPLLKLVCSKSIAIMAASCWGDSNSGRSRLFRNRWDNYKESGQSPGQASTEPVNKVPEQVRYVHSPRCAMRCATKVIFS